MGSFECSQNIEDYICEKFKLGNRKNFDQLFDIYDELINSPYQYLAHIIRTIEVYVRDKTKNEFFRITCSPTQGKSKVIKELACANYTKDSFDILYDSGITDKQQIRTCIAHELGHLLLCISANRNIDANIEPLATILGIFIMLHKQDYLKKSEKVQIRETVIVDEFIQFLERRGKIE